jgi:hypothetical protein
VMRLARSRSRVVRRNWNDCVTANPASSITNPAATVTPTDYRGRKYVRRHRSRTSVGSSRPVPLTYIRPWHGPWACPTGASVTTFISIR